MPSPAPSRICALDLIRGVAVLGILAVNVSGFAGPIATTDTPALAYGHLPPASPLDEAGFALVFVGIEGKMRALFSLLFGASMLLFIERAEARGQDGDQMQARRLLWLLGFGYLHYLLLWWGDILFDYALCGWFALMLRRLPVRALVGLGLAGFAGWHLWGVLDTLPALLAEEHVRLGTASAAEHASVARDLADTHQRIAADMAQSRLGFAAMAGAKLATAPLWPLVMTAYTMGESLPLMLLGMALYRSGFFAGAWPAQRLRAMAAWGLGVGLVWTLALLGWAGPRHFPPLAMPGILSYWAGPEHLLMALAYAALLMRAAPRLLASSVGRRLMAAGRMAFSNYLLTSVAMCALFHGWGLGLEGRVGRLGQLALAAAGWALMLGWSQPWLARHAAGPLEWLWRSLTEGRRMPWKKG